MFRSNGGAAVNVCVGYVKTESGELRRSCKSARILNHRLSLFSLSQSGFS